MVRCSYMRFWSAVSKKCFYRNLLLSIPPGQSMNTELNKDDWQPSFLLLSRIGMISWKTTALQPPGQSRQRKQDTHDCRPGSRKSNTQKGLRIRVFSQPLVVSHLNCRPRIMPTVLISLFWFNAYVIYKELLNLLRPPVSVVFFLYPEYENESVRTKGRVVLSTVQKAAVPVR
jgi:hypothetical protein